MVHSRVLLLNGNYRPLAQLSVPRAVNLLISEKVRPVNGCGIARRLRTPNTVFEVPSVIVLKRYINVPSVDKKWSRRGVLERDQYTCVYCGGRPGHVTHDRSRILTIDDFTVDHIIPSSRGGHSNWTNTACCCYECNHRKGNSTPQEVGMKLRWEPKTPRANYWVVSGNVPREWKQFFED